MNDEFGVVTMHIEFRQKLQFIETFLVKIISKKNSINWARKHSYFVLFTKRRKIPI